MIPVNFKADRKMEVVNVGGKPYMFTNLRVDRKTLPEGFVKYDVRDGSGDGMFRQIRPYVMVDHWGTIIGPDPIREAEEDGYDCLDPDGCFLDGAFTAEEFREHYDELLKECMEMAENAEKERAHYREMKDEALLEAYFSEFDDNREEDICFDSVMMMIRESYASEEIIRRVATEKEEAAMEEYLEETEEYLSERDYLLDEDDEDDGSLEELLDRVKHAEEAFKEAFLSAGKGSSFRTPEDLAGHIAGIPADDREKSLPKNIRGFGLTDADILRMFPDKDELVPGGWSAACIEKDRIRIRLYLEPEGDRMFFRYGPYTLQVLCGDDMIACISAR